jgi:Resolvase, N terminal domain
VLNACPPARGAGEASIVIDARRALTAFGMPVAAVAITSRAAFIAAPVTGLTAGETEPEGKAAKEIRALWRIVEKELAHHGNLERKRLRVERWRHVAHVESVLAEAQNVPADVGAGAGNQVGRDCVSVRGHARQGRGHIGDIGQHDRNDDRPQLAKALDACRLTGAVLVIAKLDRLSRDAHFLLGLEKAGVEFVAADMPNANRLTVRLMAVIAQEDIRAETTKIETYNEFLDWVSFGGPVIKSGDPVEQEKQLKYASLGRFLVGRALLSFGDIEAFTLRCLVCIPSDKVANTSSNLSFARRVGLLVEIIEGRCVAPGPAAELASKLKATKTLSEVRNVIAHNPLQLEVCARSAGDATAERNLISAKPQGKLIDLASLKEYVAKVEDAVSELYLAPVSAMTTATQEPLADELRAPASAPMTVRDRSPGPILRDICVARTHRRARRQQIIGWRWG